ncbi:MAG: hypothetical protein JXB00_20875 [Bacteroidales bacterium]|nr:hypothetical protein [Bacteroidales bacterium]
MNNKKAALKIILYFIICSVFIPFQIVYSQNDEAIQTLLNKSDISKIEKANEYKSQGDALIEEANQLYMETFSVQADIQLDQKAIEKKVGQLEAKAQQKQFEALELYRKCNETKYGIYKKYIEQFWSDFSGDENQYVNAKLIEEQSNDYFYQATATRNEAGKLKDRKEKIQKLNDANDLDMRALEKQITALGIYYTLETIPETTSTVQPVTPVYQEQTQSQQPVYTQPESTYTPDAQTPAYTSPVQKPTTSGAEVNQEIIEMYRQYLADSLGTDPSTLTPEQLQRITSFNADQILNIWYSYAYGQPYSPEYEEQLLAEEQTDTAAPPPVEDLSAEQYQDYEDMTVQEQATQAQQAAETELKLIEIHEGEEEKLTMLPADENVIYRVQLAANKAELTQRALQRIYYGNKQVEMIMEDGWFKYSIGDFDDYKSADKFRSQCGVKNAFIVAYRKGTRFSTPSPAEEMAMQQPAEYAVAPGAEGLTFRVQIAASHTTLNKEQIARIYPGPYPVEQVEEDGWYKYQVTGVRLFSDALKIIRDIKVRGAFISAYNNYEKMNLLEAVKISKKIEKEIQTYGRRGKVNDIEYYVQVAASQYPLRPAELSRIYPGNYKTALIYEEGWYKYRIKAGQSYEEAESIKNSTGVPKAFIVAYDRAVKIPLFQAREKTKLNN